MYFSLVCHLFVLIIYNFNFSNCGYVITTPRKWQSGIQAQVCIYLDSPGTLEDSLSLFVKNNYNEILIGETQLVIPEGERSTCTMISVPLVKKARRGTLVLKGTLDSSTFVHDHSVTLSEPLTKVFLQTDKGVYKGGQDVQFRLLTLTGPFGKVATDWYSEVWVETPTGSRIAQWLNLTNEGLVHQQFTLTDEPEEGIYKIKAESMIGAKAEAEFKVEEYVLPRFKVDVKPPNFILGSDPNVVFKVCAEYTFGQPVKGNVTLYVNNDNWGSKNKTVIKEEEILGCKEISYNSTNLGIDYIKFSTHRLIVSAEVVEKGTDVKLNSEMKKLTITRYALEFSDVGKQEFRKPELPYYSEIKAAFPDGAPASKELMQVCVGYSCRNYTTSTDGILRFTIPSHMENSDIHVRAINYPDIKASNSWRKIMHQSFYRKSLKSYHSPSNSSLIAAIDDTHLNCIPGKPIVLSFPVIFASNNQTSAFVNYQVVSRGQIVHESSIETVFEQSEFPKKENWIEKPNPPKNEIIRGYFMASISLPITIAPKAKFLVWYSRTDGEVVSDFREVEVSKCLPHQTSLEWSHVMAQPGDEVSLTLKAEPLALCSIGIVDKSVELLSSTSTRLSLGDIFEHFSKSDIHSRDIQQLNDNIYCYKKDKIESLVGPIGGTIPPIRFRIRRPYYSTSKVDALYMFHKAGLFAFSDLKIETRPCNTNRPYYPVVYDRIGGFGGGMFTSMHPALAGVPGGLNPVPRPYKPPSLNNPQTIAENESQEDSPRDFFPETWLWDLFKIDTNGILLQNLTLPDTVTEWIGSAVCVDSSEGVGLTGPATITAFRTFFIDLTLPAFVKRGEIFPLKVSVFNYLDRPLPIAMVLEKSSEYSILDSTEDTIARDGRGVVQPGEGKACVAAKDKVVFTLRIRPEVLGDVNMTVLASVDHMATKVCGNGDMEVKTDVVIKQIKVEAEGFPKEKTWSKYICSKDMEDGSDVLEYWDIKTPKNVPVVEGSERAWATAVGNLMAPSIENLGHLVRMPYGCGEQNMLNFAPNIFVMQYLEASGQAEESIVDNAIKFMKAGYQRELTYRHKDGSYSAFGERDASGSTWLTAFVVKSFTQARAFINIDTEDLTKSTTWLRGKQLENGCFESVGKIIHKGMKGGISGLESPALLTSYVLISLLEAGENPRSKSVQNAINCITKANSSTSYSLALKAYALALAKSDFTSKVINELLQSATITPSSISWPTTNDSSEKSLGVSVETAGYAILALMTHDRVNNSGNGKFIIKWMTSQRNGQGGFISTQDTIVSLQSMAVYESVLSSGPVDTTIIFDISTQTEPAFLSVNEYNILLSQRVDFDPPAGLGLSMEGRGCVLIQAVLRYNEARPPSSQAFALNVSTAIEPGVACKTHRITACTSYLLPDGASNMAIIEVALVSGFIPEKEDLKAVIGDGKGVLKRYEVDGNKVSFYVDELTDKELCVSFRKIKAIAVENAKPGTVTVYDYYKPEYSVSEGYTLSNTCLIEEEATNIADSFL